MSDLTDLLLRVGHRLQAWLGEAFRCIKTTALLYEKFSGRIKKSVDAHRNSLAGSSNQLDLQERIQDSATDFRQALVETRVDVEGFLATKKLKFGFCKSDSLGNFLNSD